MEASMKRLIPLLLAGLLCTLSAQAREIVDMAGRKVTIPDHIERVFGSAPPLNVLLHAVAPETMIGLSFPVTDEARPFFPARLQGLPVAGGIFGMGQQMNAETVIGLKPDIALAWKSPFIDQTKIEGDFAKTGVPMVFIQLDKLSDWPAALRYTGKLLGHEKTAETEATYVEQALLKVGKFVATVPEAKRPRVYYAEGPDGLATDCNTSFHTEAIELAGGYNVYRCQPKDHMGMERISLEQVIAFNPEIIVTHERNFAAIVRNEPRWQGIKAVKEGRIHLIPKWPHNWIDRPPSVMRVLGVQWLASVFYPKSFAFDVHAQTRAFYTQFLGVTPSDAQIDALFK
jgi:iron complex transport system substrate-binding protein